MKGTLISLEGISETGKTFYRKKLEEEYKDNNEIIFIKEIFDEAQKGLNSKIFSALYHTEDRFFNMGVPLTETMLLLSSIMYKYESTIREALENGKVVVEDRGIDTIAVYQGILIAQRNDGNPLQIAQEIFDFSKLYRRPPDTTFLFKGDTDFAIRRAEIRDKSEYTPEEIKLLKRVEKLYSLYSEKHKDRIIPLDISEHSTEEIYCILKGKIDKYLELNKER